MKYLYSIVLSALLLLPALASACSLNTNSMSLNGTNQSAYILSQDFGINSGQITMVAWVKPSIAPTSGNKYNILFHSSNTGNVFDELAYQNSAGTLQLIADRNKGNVAANSVTFNVTLSTAAWTGVAYVFDGADVRILMWNGSAWVDEADVASSGTGTGTSGCNDFLIGNSDQSQTCNTTTFDAFWWNGAVDDARVYNSGLTTTQLLTNAQQELVPPVTNLVAYYTLDNTLTDSTSNGYNLTGQNTPTFTSDVPFVGSCPSVAVPFASFFSIFGDW